MWLTAKKLQEWWTDTEHCLVRTIWMQNQKRRKQKRSVGRSVGRFVVWYYASMCSRTFFFSCACIALMTFPSLSLSHSHFIVVLFLSFLFLIVALCLVRSFYISFSLSPSLPLSIQRVCACYFGIYQCVHCACGNSPWELKEKRSSQIGACSKIYHVRLVSIVCVPTFIRIRKKRKHRAYAVALNIGENLNKVAVRKLNRNRHNISA